MAESVRKDLKSMEPTQAKREIGDDDEEDGEQETPRAE